MTDLFIDGGNASSTYTQPTVSPAPVFAPDATSYSLRTPYITATEFREAGTGVDVGQLVPGGTTAEQTPALTRNIAQASGIADTYCRKILAATEDVDPVRQWLSRGGIVSVPLRFTPVVAVTGISVGIQPWSLAPLPDLSCVAIQKPGLVRFAASGCATARPWVEVTYVNGWTCTTLAAAAALGDTTVTLASNVGIEAGQTLTLDDGASIEVVTVDASFVAGSTGPVQLTAPLAAGHAAGAAFSAIPADIKRAVVLLTSALIKTRGNEAFVMQSLNAEPTTATTGAGGSDDITLARQLLADYRRSR